MMVYHLMIVLLRWIETYKRMNSFGHTLIEIKFTSISKAAYPEYDSIDV